MKTVFTKVWDGKSLKLTAKCADGRFAELHAMCGVGDVWCTFGYMTIDGDEDNLYGYRLAELTAAQEGELDARFEKEIA
jgi:hypothetical protein